MGLICDGTTTKAAIHHSITKAGGTADGMLPALPYDTAGQLFLMLPQPEIDLFIIQYVWQWLGLIPWVPIISKDYKVVTEQIPILPQP